ncbi:MAG TPA: transposase, partial [Rhizomicrobium sp.]|nr:transposase [Rhizomicrobium sp.]
MKSRTKNRARIEWWQIHIEAWQRSGLSQRRYCREHRLDVGTFARWLKNLADVNALKIKRELEREERAERRRRARSPLTPDMRSRASGAFWAMHVEALRWSGMHLNTYAKALRLSPYSLRKWRDLLESGEQMEDWRAGLHPSARANLSTSARPGAKETSVETGLTDAPTAVAKPTRRCFSADEKRAIVLETECPGATVSSIARKHDLVTSVLFRWRAELGFGKDKRAKLATVKLTGGNADTGSASLLLHGLIPPPDGMSPVELEDGR